MKHGFKYLLILTATYGLVAKGDAPSVQLPKALQDQIIKELSKAGEGGKDISRLAPPAAAMRSPVGPSVSHNTWCQVNGGKELTLTKAGEWDGNSPWIVTVQEYKDGDLDTVKVEDAKVNILKDFRADRSVETRWGLGGKSTSEIKVFYAKFHVSSEVHVLGMKIEGCIGRDVKEVTVHALCFDSKTTFGGLVGPTR